MINSGLIEKTIFKSEQTQHNSVWKTERVACSFNRAQLEGVNQITTGPQHLLETSWKTCGHRCFYTPWCYLFLAFLAYFVVWANIYKRRVND